MKFYHGTQDGSLKKLSLAHSSGKIYLTDSYSMAFLYAANPLRNWGYDKQNDKLIIREVAKDTFKKLYQGRKCYIFECECDNFVKDEKNISGHTFLTNEEVVLGKRETIDDAYQKLLQLEKDGLVILRRWEDYSEEEKIKVEEKFKNTFNSDVMREEKKYPSYAEIIKLYPEIEVKD